ncbi:MAG: hypothetical protein KTR32_04840 [Granulosicoccus sp.]|nr:hypothetical protein [Granulosicoccus sp.]
MGHTSPADEIVVAGIWVIIYGISGDNSDRYLAWFEGQHVEEKLSRPGYDWAAHYAISTGGPCQSSDLSYIAMFGAESSRVFFDPSPQQIKPHQSELTREMIGYRQNATSLIVSEEWADFNSSNGSSNSAVSADTIKLTLFADSTDDQTIGSACAQDFFPAVSTHPHWVSVRKWLSSAGTPRHLALEEYQQTSGTGPAVQTEKLNLPDPDMMMIEPAVAQRSLFRD